MAVCHRKIFNPARKAALMVIRGQKLELCPMHSHLWNTFGLILFFPVRENWVVGTFNLPMPIIIPQKSSQTQPFNTSDANL